MRIPTCSMRRGKQILRLRVSCTAVSSFDCTIKGYASTNPPGRVMNPQHLPLDEIDRALIRALSRNARASGAALAAEVGVAESTVSSRIRRLQSAGEIRGYHVEL